VDPRLVGLNAELARIDPNFVGLILSGRESKGTIGDPDGVVARVFGAEPGTLYLLRPDLHIAGRWRTLAAEEVVAELRSGLGWRPP
jgi:3-(3-hydroxy-phenyl)propionate hydroxylase